MKTIVAAIIALVLVIPSSYASESFYVGISVGDASAEDACGDDVIFAVSCDDSDTGAKIFGGIQVTENWGFEISLIDLGELSSSLPGTRETIETVALSVSGIGTWPISKEFGVFGKLGLYRWDIEDTVTTGTSSLTIEDNGIDIMFGFGARVHFTKRVGARLEWEHFKDVGDEQTTGQSQMNMISAGVSYSF